MITTQREERMSESLTSRERPTEQPTSPVRIRKEVLGISLLCAVLVGGMAAVKLTGLREWFQSVPEASARIRSMGMAAPVLFACAAAVLVAMGLPRLFLCPVAGMAFGFLPGLLWGQLGTLLGCYGLFIFARWAGRDFVVRHRPRLGKLGIVLEPRSVAAVALIRQLPLTAMIINLMLAVSPVSHRRFLIGTAVGILPEALPVTLIGTGIVQKSLTEATGDITLGCALLLAAWIAAVFCARKLKRKRRPAETKQGP